MSAVTRKRVSCKVHEHTAFTFLHDQIESGFIFKHLVQFDDIFVVHRLENGDLVGHALEVSLSKLLIDAVEPVLIQILDRIAFSGLLVFASISHSVLTSVS